jgi:hypothetical protein
VGYPDLLEFRQGLLVDGLEMRLEGLGVGAKYQFKRLKAGVNLALEIYYGLRDMRKGEEKGWVDLRGIFGLPIDTGLGIINLTAGAGLRGNDPSYFAGFDSYITPHLKFLTEYDSWDGAAVGLRYDFTKGMMLTLGAGVTPERTPRFDLYFSIQR